MFKNSKLASAVAIMVALAPLAAQAKWADTNQKHDNAILVTTPSTSNLSSPQPSRLSERATPGNMVQQFFDSTSKSSAPGYPVSAEAQSGEGG